MFIVPANFSEIVASDKRLSNICGNSTSSSGRRGTSKEGGRFKGVLLSWILFFLGVTLQKEEKSKLFKVSEETYMDLYGKIYIYICTQYKRAMFYNFTCNPME